MALHPSIRIEGGLLGPDVIEQLLSADLPGQRNADFGVESRRSLTDEVAAAFADARALWGVFQRRLERVAADDVATTVTRDAWVIPFLGLLGYEPRYNPRAYEVDGLSFAISHRADEAEHSPPIHIVGFRQELGRVPASGRPRLAPHSLVQEYLNRTEHLWGIVTNGQTLRLLRDCTFVRRQAYVEFDLVGLLEEQRFQDFAALYRLLHRTRLPKAVDDADECLLEKYYQHSQEQGGRVREHLREGVEKCLVELANGFLRHRDNDDLCRRIAATSGNDRISADDFYRQLLILVYRFLFLLVSEDRGLLSADPLYREHYSIARLRRLLGERSAFTDHDDLWQSLRVLWLVLTRDEPQPALGNQPLASTLGLPVLNGDLFAWQALEDATISNQDLLTALWHLAWYQEGANAPPRRVNYAALDVEELGSVYESLLEFHPAIDLDSRGRPVFSFVTGSERKTTGSYYTPPELVGELIKSALEPVIADRLQGKSSQREKADAILSIRVCDPACGSGHFLLAAARRLGKELARVRTGEDEPAPERVRESIREVISHCIFGVDRNPLAVDLCRVALWLESHTSDKPLTFLDHHIRCGDSLVGVFDLNILSDGIPDKAFQPLEGDDKTTARELAKQNRDERAGVQELTGWAPETQLTAMNRQSRDLDAIADDSPEAIRRKKRLFAASHEDPSWLHYKQACDLWTSAFFQPLRPDAPAITTAALAHHLQGRPMDAASVGRANAIASSQRFFHWPLEFPDVFASGGFDVLLSNPPWEHVELKEQEFFASRDASIAGARTKAERSKGIKKLQESRPELFREYINALRDIDGIRQFLAASNRYPLTGRGRINTYAVFAELASEATNDFGRSGIIVPTGIATDDTTKYFFSSLVQTQRLVDLIGFENESFIFPAVHHAFKFCKLTIAGQSSPAPQSRIAFFIRHFSDLSDEHRFFHLRKSDFSLLNPNTGNCPIFRTRADAELTKAIYRRVPILWREAAADRTESNPWRIQFQQGLFNLSSDSHHFRTADELTADGYRLEGNSYVSPFDRYLPLYEAKMLQQFDHRFSTYEGATDKQINVGILPQPSAAQKRNPSFVVQPRFWVREEVVESTLPLFPEPLGLALRLGSRSSIQRVLCYWIAGYHLNRGNTEAADTLLDKAVTFDVDRQVDSFFASLGADESSKLMESDYPLTKADVERILIELEQPEVIVQDMVDKHSPKWLIGWRDISNATNERTLIVSAMPRVAVGNSYPLLQMPGVSPTHRLVFEAIADSFVVDYVARQKVGGTHINYFYLKQFPFLQPDNLNSPASFAIEQTLGEWLFPRVFELVYTAHDLAPLAADFSYSAPPFQWDEDRRFTLRCEIDAAIFHAYLPCGIDGNWMAVSEEAMPELAAVREHFLTPRDAVAYILEQFPIVRQKDLDSHGEYRTKSRILEIYDSMLASIRNGQPFQSPLNPPPGRMS